MLQIPKITKYLLIINIMAYLIATVFSAIPMIRMSGAGLDSVLGLHFFMAPDFQIFQLFTYMFMHAGFAHLFFNMFALWMFGCVVERVWGPKRFLLYYIVCGVGAGLFQEVAQLVEFYMMCENQIPGFTISKLGEVANNSSAIINMWNTVGASGAIYGILLAFGMLFPEDRIFIFPLPIPIKAKWFVMIYAAVELFSTLSTASDGVAHIAHLGGMVVGFFLIRHWRKTNYNSFHFSRSGRWANIKFSNPTSTRANSDWDYNAEKVRKQKEVDAILDKVRKSGYDSLSTEEKQKLFDASRN